MPLGQHAGCYIARMAADETSEPRSLERVCLVSLIAFLLVALWLVEWLLGRELLSDSGFGVWTGAWTHQTSQWLMDPYTFSHVLHGFLLYYLLQPTRRLLSVKSRFLVASLIEASWEILENTPFVIDRYRDATAAIDYYGDSILNSMFDLIAAMAGFWAASKYHWKCILTLAVMIELLCLFFVRDNLTLNVLMLLNPSEAIKQWQLGH